MYSLSLSSLLLCVVLLAQHTLTASASPSPLSSLPSGPNDAAVLKRQSSPSTAPLVDFQVYSPVLTPEAGPNGSDEYGCVYTKTLMEYDFANSYGAPFVGNYTPPPCSFNRVTMNFTAHVAGVQFDRLAFMYLGSTEVWRTSTAEPTSNGIVWTYVKEMQQYDALWKTDQTIIFELDNIVNDQYTGIYNTTLTATFFTVPDSPPVANTILPISSLSGPSDKASVFTVPGDNASVAYSIPKNVERAVISLAACGQIDEEFWYTNTLTSEENTFAATTGALYGGSPWREVQILIDGQLAGVSWPFPIIFTGGIVPGFWRPIVGIDAFDLREHEIDITAWLPYLQDGATHTFEIQVASLNDDGHGHVTVASTPPVAGYWLVSGKIFLFSGPNGSKTTGDKKPTISAPAPTFSVSSHVTTNVAGQNETLTYTVDAQRHLSISATVNGKHVAWTQSLSYSNFNALTQQGLTQFTQQTTTGKDQAILPEGYPNGALYESSYSYPLTVNSTYDITADGSVGINGTLSRGLDIQSQGPSVFPSGVQPFNSSTGNTCTYPSANSPLTPPQQITLPDNLPPFSGSSLNETQTGSAEYFSSSTGSGSYSFGTTAVDYSFNGVQQGGGGAVTELYERSVEAVNNTIAYDHQTLLGRVIGGGLNPLTTGPGGSGSTEQQQQVAGYRGSVRAQLGRGPGQQQQQQQL